MDIPWQYDETIQVGTDYCSSNEVRAYDQRMRRLRNVDQEAEPIRDALGLLPDSTVWEIGTGTGECALALARNIRHVYATDVSPAMLEYARRKAQRRRIRNVTFERGGFLSGFRPGHHVDGIVTQLALHHLPDYWKARALDTAVKNLRPGGRLYLRDVVFPSTIENHDLFFQKAIDEIRVCAGEEAAEQTIQHIKTEFSTLDWILEGLIVRSGLKIVETDSTGFLSAYVCEKIIGD